ncbi:uncharacterized protein TRIVIDRAFT_46993 [Trichoderma virens Gv29-8]|uniref:Aromatic amino acid beta-eliminating lyase/threonine aldolase domain-containing protein n=1 Tax=Hypocrea virens (strain Gv29-8 / FGSC 10586) TaxID=413071 RepID=G9N0K4_HYPVG|nr:uncharacterized protein TRIVIDRAFT_46993 [Trichoderma virens Gv29-8]EHK19886.1 hypothetical protein TRIVIDRAFT_46993 [Trichoderma virens Gv29-8]
MPLDCSQPEGYKAKMIEQLRPSTREEREKWIQQADYNLFNLHGDQVYIDLLTDSGTGAMSHYQWAALMRGDEAYAGSTSFHHLKEKVQELFGFSYIVPVHQGRAAEHALAQALLNEESVVPGNTHFNTTRAHIEYRQATAIDCAIEGAFQIEYQHPFKGNVNLLKLEEVLQSYSGNVPMIIVTITCNMSGGQPVSMHNLRQLREIAKRFNVPVIINSARFAENAWFIQEREPGYGSWTISDIVREMYHNADGMIISGKKDGLVNVGGLFATNNRDLFNKVRKYILLCEGYQTNGGLTGRDMEAFAVGLNEVTQQKYLDDRISQVYRFGKMLIDANIPVQQPIGGHAIVIDASAFLPHVSQEEYVAQTLAVELYVEAGIRGAEMGALLSGRDPITGNNRPVATEFLRLAIPRRTYTNDQLAFVANALRRIHDRRLTITRGLYIVHEDVNLGHLTIQMIRAEEKTVAV